MQTTFFSLLEIVRLFTVRKYTVHCWSPLDKRLSDMVLDWKDEVRFSSAITPHYISKIAKYVLEELPAANFQTTVKYLIEWKRELLAEPLHPPPRIYIPRRSRLEIYYRVMSTNKDKNHFHVMEEIEANYLPSLFTDLDVTGVQIVGQILYLARLFSFILLRSTARRKNRAKTIAFLEKLDACMVIGMDAWSKCGPQARAVDLFNITEILFEIDERVENAGFRNETFYGAKGVVLFWSRAQEWYRRIEGQQGNELQVDSLGSSGDVDRN
jgi:hypothetical protein